MSSKIKKRSGNFDPSQYPSEKGLGCLGPNQYAPEIRTGDRDPTYYSQKPRISSKDPREYSSIRISDNSNPEEYTTKMRTGGQDLKHFSPEIRPGNEEPRLYSSHMRPAGQESRKYSPEIRLDNLDPRQYTSEIRPGDQDFRQATGMNNASNRRLASQYPEDLSDVGPGNTGFPSHQQHSDPSSPVDPNSIRVSEKYPNNTTFTQNQDSDSIVFKKYGKSVNKELKHTLERTTSISKFTDDLANGSAQRYNFAPNTNREINPVESEYLNDLNHILLKDGYKDSIIPDLNKLLIRIKASDLSMHKFINKLISYIKKLTEDLPHESKSDLMHGGRPLASSTPFKGAKAGKNISTDETADPSRGRKADGGSLPRSLIRDANRPGIGVGKSLHERRGLASRGRILTPKVINIDSKTMGTWGKKSMYPRFGANKAIISSGKRPRSPSYNTDTLKNGADKKITKKEPANNTNNAKSKNEQDYCTQLQNKLQEWINYLGVDLKDDKKFFINELALDIANTQKYLQLNPYVTISNEERLEYMKHQIFNRLNRKVDPATLTTIMSHVDTLMERVGVPFPPLTQPEERNDITAAHESDLMDTILEKWCDSLPLPYTTMAEAKAIRRDIFNKIKAQIVGHNMDPEVGFKTSYEQMILDYIDELLNILPIDHDDVDSTQLNLTDKKNVDSHTKGYKQQLRDTISIVSPKINNPTEDEQASFEVFKDDLADAFINLHYVGDDEALKNKFKNKIRVKINEFANEYLKSDPTKPLSTAQLESDLYNALKSVEMPNDESMRSEAELARMKDLVHDWAKQLPLKERTPRDKVEINKVLSRLAMRMYELEKEKHISDPIHEYNIRREIEKHLQELPLRSRSNLNSMIDKLHDEIKNSEHSRTLNEGNRRSVVENKHGIPPSHLTQEEKEHLQRIKNRVHVPKKPIDLSSRPPWIPASMKSTTHRLPLHHASQTDVADGKYLQGQSYNNPRMRPGARWQCPPPMSHGCHFPPDCKGCVEDYNLTDCPMPINTQDRSSLPALSSSYLMQRSRYFPPCITPDMLMRTTSPCMERRRLLDQDNSCQYNILKPLIVPRHGRLNRDKCTKDNRLLSRSSRTCRPHIYRECEDISSPYIHTEERQVGNPMDPNPSMKPSHSMSGGGSRIIPNKTLSDLEKISTKCPHPSNFYFR